MRTISLAGFDFKATLAIDSSVQPYNYITMIASDLRLGDCDAVVKWASDRFGSASIAIDGTYKSLDFGGEHWMKFVLKETEWNIGPTRINVSCIGTYGPNDEKGGLSSLVLISHISNTKQLKPYVAIQCTRKMRFLYGPDRPIQETDDIVFVIDENYNYIRNAHNVPIGQSVSIRDDSIEFSTTPGKEKDVIIEHKIDRVLGTYKAVLKDAVKARAEVSGKCDRADVGKPRF